MEDYRYLTRTLSGTVGGSVSAIVYGPYRYELCVTWSKQPRIVAVGLNPPDGDDLKLTNTTAVLVNYAKLRKFGGVTMLNLYAWKATLPAHLFAASKRGENVIGPGNHLPDLKIRILQHLTGGATLLACWGKHGTRRGHDLITFLGDGFSFHCLGVNNDGSPIHPLHSTLKKLKEYNLCDTTTTI